ncbi:MAG: DNA mismatch repair endonuclease MutL [Desulfuromusa sp.]|nr:DNA mismatch repair endonuclease MutL [Desulfuromusa sp.]
MKNKIHVLPEELCNKIAAGEVVERPSSVVKELLENSLDAGSSDILIELEAGGKRLIRITDNGCGMNRQDAFLSFERHATSKIRTDSDLFALTTLGFRGEALASIASVSRLRLRTCDNDEGLGQQIYAEGGKIKNADEIGLPRGTIVEVRNLFFNLPARKKFMRKEQTELGHSADVVTKQALANPMVSFRLKHNDRTMLELRREKGVRERVAALLGRSLLHDLLPLGRENGDELQLSGLISQPQLTRSAASHIYTFINGRYIRDRVVQHAVMEGYRHLLMKGRYPVVVLFLQIDPAQVDVNVHPTKHEVRFREQSMIHDFIAKSLQQTLRPAEWLEKGMVESSVAHVGNYSPEPQIQVAKTDDKMQIDGSVRESSGYYLQPVGPCQENHLSSDHTEQQLAPPFYPPPRSGKSDDIIQYTLPGSEAAGFFTRLQILGQYHQSYILCQDSADLILIDQHAAHERVGFEKLRHAYAAGTIPSQTLLFPEVLELDFNSATALGDNQHELENLGFEIEPFGGKSFALKAIPQLLENRAAARLVVDVALELERIGRTGQLRESIDEILILMACHSVIRANQALAIVEIKALLQELDRIDFKANCPHGRPVMQRMTLTQIERLFRRQ